MQEMKYFIPNDTFDKAIRNKEKGVLRALLIGIIGSDPTFETKEYDEAVAYVKRKSESDNGSVLNLNQPYQKQEGEYTKVREDWDEKYFQMLLVWYRDNYADERLQTIQAVGKVVYDRRPTLGKSKEKNRRSQTSGQTNISHTQFSQKDSIDRPAGNNAGKEQLTITDWFKKNLGWLTVIGFVVVLLYLLIFRK